jgi:hypothetical protein
MRIIEDHSTFKAANLAGGCFVCCSDIVDESAVQTGSSLWSDREWDSRLF